MVHVRQVDGRSLSFGHRGWLWHNAYLLYDTETDSIWHHQTGWAMSGPLRGKVLDRYPTSLSTWSAWREEFPESMVLAKPPAHPEEIDADVYAARNRRIGTGVGLDLPGAFRLYPHGLLAAAEGGLIEDAVLGVPVLVLATRVDGALGYDRRVDGQTLSFVAEAGPDGTTYVRDREGRRRWRARSGRPDRASGAVSRLRRLHASVWEREAWLAQHPAGSEYPAAHRLSPPQATPGASPGSR